jgi:hypothetical protein
MTKVKATLRDTGIWPSSRVSERLPSELTTAAKRQAQEVIAQLTSLGVSTALDRDRRVRFQSAGKAMPVRARRLVELYADQIEAALKEQPQP